MKKFFTIAVISLCALWFGFSGSAQEDPVTNPGFEELDEAGWAPGWQVVGSVVEVSSMEAHSGKNSLRLFRTPEIKDPETGLNRDWKPDSGEQGTMLSQKKGWISFWYKAIKGKGSVRMLVIPMSAAPMEDTGEQRSEFSISADHFGDGKWHQGWVKYDYSNSGKVKWVHIAPRITGREGEIFLDDFAYAAKKEGMPVLSEVSYREPGSAGEEAEVRAVVANAGDLALDKAKIELKIPAGLKSDKPVSQALENIPASGSLSVAWRISGIGVKPEKAGVILYNNKGEAVQSKDVTLRVISGTDKGLVAWWKFDENQGSTVKDHSGNGFDGEMAGDVEWAPGTAGSAGLFRGGYVEVPFDEKLAVGKAVTIQAWVCPTDYEIDTYKGIVMCWDNYLLRFDNPPEGGRPSFFVFLDGAPEPRVQGKVPDLNKWHSITAVWDGKNEQIWVDGVKSESGRPGKPSSKPNNLRIGEGYFGLIDDIRVYNRVLTEDEIVANLPPNLIISPLMVSNALAETGKNFTLSCEVRNGGGKPARDGIVEITLPKGMALVEGLKKVSIASLYRKEPQTVKWVVRSDVPVADNASISVSFSGLEPQARTAKFIVGKPILKEGDIFSVPALVKSGDDYILGNSKVRLVFPKNDFGYGVFAVDANKGGKWNRMAVSTSLSQIAVKKGQDTFRKLVFCKTVIPLEHGAGSKGIELKDIIDDGAGTKWNVRFSFIVGKDDRIKVDYEAVPDNDGSLVYMQGPTIYAGEGNFGAKKDDGLFCGLEWLAGDERSSSNLDMHDPDYYVRFVPHPNKVTIPFMAVAGGNCAVAVMWDALQKWDGKNIRPSSVYAVPNFVDGQDNMLMGLFLPSVPEFVKQNTFEAADPYPFKKGVPLKISSYIVAASNVKNSIDCLDRWFATYGVIDPAPLPRGSYVKEIEFSMRAYFESLWIENEKTWWTSKGGGEMSQKGLPPSFAYQLRLASVMTKDETLKNAYLDKVAEAGKLGGFTVPSGEDMGFTWANPSGAMLGFAGRAGSQLDGMWEDGSWRFRTRIGTAFPFKGYDYGLLGPDKAFELGTCARSAYEILQYARMSGDRDVFDMTRKSLDFMEQFNIPRAAQVWECPVHSPDILAAADAVDAYIEAYRFSGEKQYLDEAVRWAWAGLPFVFFWEEPGYYMMRYASIAIFGGSQYNSSWIGQPVQWNGLRYAYSILKLADYDKSLPWGKIGEGITISAMYQQDTEGKDVALWPDNFSTANGKLWSKCPWVFEPGMILKNVYRTIGRDLEPATYMAGTGNEKLYINARAKISNVSWKDGALKFGALFPEGEGGGYILIACADRPAKVALDGKDLAENKKIYGSSVEGWKYESGQAHLVLRIASTGPHAVEISGEKYRYVTMIPKQTDKLDFRFDKDMGGWAPANQIENLGIDDGVMKGDATGGDPYMQRPRIKINGSLCGTIKVKMKTNFGNGIAIFWVTSDSGDYAEDKVIHLPATPDNKFHEYIFEVGKNSMWAGKTITSIRLDPVEGGNGGKFEVEYFKGE